jgi:hypothetical protein
MTKRVRIFSAAGPCLMNGDGAGPVVRETAAFYITQLEGERERRVSKSRSGVHVEACRCCRDHQATMYPHGYMD